LALALAGCSAVNSLPIREQIATPQFGRYYCHIRHVAISAGRLYENGPRTVTTKSFSKYAIYAYIENNLATSPIVVHGRGDKPTTIKAGKWKWYSVYPLSHELSVRQMSDQLDNGSVLIDVEFCLEPPTHP
jgi:hypothetical protein